MQREVDNGGAHRIGPFDRNQGARSRLLVGMPSGILREQLVSPPTEVSRPVEVVGRSVRTPGHWLGVLRFYGRCISSGSDVSCWVGRRRILLTIFANADSISGERKPLVAKNRETNESVSGRLESKAPPPGRGFCGARTVCSCRHSHRRNVVENVRQHRFHGWRRRFVPPISCDLPSGLRELQEGHRIVTM